MARGAPEPAGAGRGGAALLGWLALLGAVLVGAWRLGATPALATPPVTDPGRLAAWASAGDPVEAAFALLRLAVVAGAGYLLATTALATCFAAARAARLSAALDRVTVPIVRRVVQGALGAGLVGVSAATPAAVPWSPGADVRLVAAAAPAGQPPPPAVDRWQEPSPPGDHPEPAERVAAGAPTMERVDDGPPVAAAGEVTLAPGTTSGRPPRRRWRRHGDARPPTPRSRRTGTGWWRPTATASPTRPTPTSCCPA
jgi:hypothetical protein